ncbi:MAG: STAS domain-containing protein [Bacillota bacterium]
MSDNAVTLIQEKEIDILKPEGEIVFANSHTLKEKTKSIIEENDINELILDLDAISYLDSSGVGFIISLLKFLREKKGKLVITNLNSKVRRVCELTKLNEIINIYESNEKAVKDFN